MNKETICTLDSFGKENLKDWFMSQKWHMEYRLNSQNQNEAVEITLRDIKNRSEISYDIKMAMKDSVGGSIATGILIINVDHFKMKLEKTYNNRDSAGQTDEYDILLYEGDQ